MDYLQRMDTGRCQANINSQDKKTNFRFEVFEPICIKTESGYATVLAPIPLSPEYSSSCKRFEGRPRTTSRRKSAHGEQDNRVSLQVSKKEERIKLGSKVVFEERVQVFTYLSAGHDNDSVYDDDDDDEASVSAAASAEDLKTTPSRSRVSSPINSSQREHLSAWSIVDKPNQTNLANAPKMGWVWDFRTFLFWSCQADNEE